MAFKQLVIFLGFFVAGSLLATRCWGQIDFSLPEGIILDEVVSGWEGSFGSGLNGKTGNSESVDINMTLNLARETDLTKTTIAANYFYGSNAIATVTDRANGQIRHERKLANPRLSVYSQVRLEWDRFKAYDYRIAIHGGLAYQVYDLDNHSLKLRFGSGASREVGGSPGLWLPELQFGADWERKLSDVTRLYATIDYYPNVKDFSDFRLNTNTGLDFVLDAERNINFRVFALNRYDSTPVAGNRKSDTDYGMSIVVGF